jgi:CRP-like cAMP-binding protein
MPDTLMMNIDSGALERIGKGAAAHQEVLDMLVGTPMFTEFDPAEIQLLSDYLYAYRAKKGTVLFNEGERGQYMCVLIDGKVGIYKEDEAGSDKKKMIATVRKGKTMGEMAIIDGEHYSATAVAIEPSVIIIVTTKNFDLITQQQPRLGIKLVVQVAKFISQRLRQTTGILVDYMEK